MITPESKSLKIAKGAVNLVGKRYNSLTSTLKKQAIGGGIINGGYDLYNQTKFEDFSNIDYTELGTSVIGGAWAATSKYPFISGATVNGGASLYTEIRDKGGVENLDKDSANSIGVNTVFGGVGGKFGY